ncbi:MAG: hypothetical protein PHH85_07005 [Candidatus Methanoperedens sp.]|nr:hypothetical protein [Candidatus Methanoperedens sp.]
MQFRKVIHISGVLVPFLAGENLFGMLAGAVSKHDNIAVPYAALIAMVLAQWIATLV